MLASDFANRPPKDYAYEKGWHGLSCCCGGGYRVGHQMGCQWANKEANLGQLKADLQRAKDNNDAVEVADLERIKAELEALPQ